MRLSQFYFYLIILILFILPPVQAQDTLRICAIRIEFQTDDNPLTTGDGRFLYDDTNVSPFTIDPPPHDRPYFQDQIKAVANYFAAASNQNLYIHGDVFPLGNSQSYQLTQEMGFYNPNTSEEQNNYQLTQLFIDAVQKADQDSDINFSEYDLVTVFHAGVGNDIELGFDETPQDIPSLFISEEFLKKSRGNTFSGISVDGGTTIIKEGILLPETESQADFELALTGIFAANIGSFLGLYDLFSPSTKLPGIGRFGLMDSGLFNLFGLAPALPSAFSRELLGWDKAILLSAPQPDVEIARYRGIENQVPTLIKIQSTRDEYYLLEYRGNGLVNIDSLYFELSAGRDTAPTYLELLKNHFPDQIVVSDSTGVLLSIDDYDLGLPGAGILIWHIDRSVLSEQSAVNAINDDRNNRAVDLEEADGSQDIGYEYSIIDPGFNSELGTLLDFWYRDNPAPLYQNEFSKNSSPNSRTNRNFAESHIELSEFSVNRGNVMTFDYQKEYFEEGFPIALHSNQSMTYSNLIAGRLETGNRTAIFLSDSSGRIYSVTDSGSGLLYRDKFQLAQFSLPELPLLALADINADDRYDHLIASAKSGCLNIFRFTDINADSLIDTVATLMLPEEISTVPVVKDDNLYSGTVNGKIFRFSLNSLTLDSVYVYPAAIRAMTIMSKTDLAVEYESDTVIPPVIIDLDSDGQFETVRLVSDNRFQISDGENIQTIVLESDILASPAFADLVSNGSYEIIYHEKTKIQAIYYNGSSVANFPIVPKLQQAEVLIGTPLVLDIDRDDRPDIISLTSAGRLFIYGQDGQPKSGFPASAGGTIKHTPLAADIDNDDRIELILLNQYGDLFSWEFAGAMTESAYWWNQSYYSPTNNQYIVRTLQPVVSEVSELMPAKSVYNYPNPNQQDYTIIRYFLREDAQVQIRIFDLAGDLVDKFDGPGQGNVYNEKRWQLGQIESGIYLCRIEAQSEQDKSVKIIKIMVVN